MFDRVLEYVTGPTFRSRMRAVIAETGWRPVSRSPVGVGFELTYGGREYAVLAHAAGPRVEVEAWSNARFALHRFPPALAAVLVRRNRELPKCDWKQHDGARESWPALVTTVTLAELDGELMRAAVGYLLAEVELLDDGLRKNGLMG